MQGKFHIFIPIALIFLTSILLPLLILQSGLASYGSDSEEELDTITTRAIAGPSSTPSSTSSSQTTIIQVSLTHPK